MAAQGNMSETMHQTALENGNALQLAAEMTWGQILAEGQKRLKEAGIAEYNLDAWYLFEHAFGISRMQYFMCSARNAEPEDAAWRKFSEGIRRRSSREPLQHILGTQEFMGLEFYVNQHTLIPRQDTETLVELVLSEHKKKETKLLDMCTGSGCIAISLAAHGGYACVEAADISVEALKTAGRNAKKLLNGWKVILADSDSAAVEHTSQMMMEETSGVPARNAEAYLGVIRFRHSDMFAAFDEAEDAFDMIVSNPPYIPSDVIEELEPEVRDFEPRGALDGTADGLFFYEILARECGRFLKEDGAVYFEIGHDQGKAVKALLDANGFYDTKVIKDLAGNDRVVCGRWQTK